MAKRLGERLIDAGLISADAVAQALSHQQITSQRLGDCLVELGLVPETTLLRFLAVELNTQFVSAQKLAAAKISPGALEKIPVRMAEAENVLPVALDTEQRILSVVMAEPQNLALVRELALITDMKQVIAYVGVRSAIQAGIKKHYYRDPTAFAALEAGAGAVKATNLKRPAGGEGSAESSGISGTARTASRLNPSQLGVARGSVAESDFLETLNVLVGLLELQHKNFAGHSAQVARQAALIARRIGLQPREVSHTSVAAYLHDLGKPPGRHFTLPLLALQPDLRGEARRASRAPTKLFEAVHLAGGVNAVLAQLYEAYDGSGLPQGARGEDIIAGARIIAAVDAFFDLTRNPANPFGRLLPKQEALDSLHQHSGTLFDPVIVDTLTALQSGDLLRQRVENDGRQVFVADPDEAARTDLMDALTKAGLVPQSVLKLDAVIDAVLAAEADTISVGLGYGVADLAELTEFLRSRPESANLPLLVIGEPTDPAGRVRLLQAGVTSFVASSASADQTAAAIRSAYLDRLEHGGVGHVVRGGFDELNPAELTRILGANRKSGRISVRSGSAHGFFQFERGRVVFASLGDRRGEAALAPLLALPQADFQYDPEALLLDLPNLDQDLELLSRSLSSR
jgi:HD-GYP domain-containing protein (c-di-GMP phosphodiesterase class II)